MEIQTLIQYIVGVKVMDTVLITVRCMLMNMR